MQLLGLEFADLDAAGAAEMLARRAADAAFGYVTTPNADHLVRLHRRPELRAVYDGAMLRLLDSRVVALAAGLIGLPAPRVARGSDLAALVLVRHLAAGERITIIGVAPAWVSVLAAHFDLSPPAHLSPSVGFEHDPAAMREAVDFVLAHPARFVFLAVGSPRQEMLAAAIRASGQASGVGLCIGAGLEFAVGARPRAPTWMQDAGLEWLHRLGCEPHRLARRYLLDCPAILPLLLHERLAMH